MPQPTSPWYVARLAAGSPSVPVVPRRVGPSASEYVAAVQSRAFLDDLLREATPRAGMLGLPMSATGQQAVVFPMTTVEGTVAVRFFSVAPDVRRERYRLLAEHLAEHPCEALCGFRWIDEAVRVSDQTWPALVMPWLDGQRLDRAVEDRLRAPERLRALADGIVAAHRDLRANGLAHGDLQHGNVLVMEGDAIKLVDLDSVWAPTLADRRPGECGHPNYQHPDRVERGRWGERVDTFSVLLLSLSLRALAADPGLWRHNNGDNLIFTAEDLQRPGTTQVWHDLSRVATGELATELDAFRRLCLATTAPEVELDDVPGLHDAPPGAQVEGAWWAGMSRANGHAPAGGRAGAGALPAGARAVAAPPPAPPAPLAPPTAASTAPGTLPAPAAAAAPAATGGSIVERLKHGEISSAAAVVAGTVGALVVVALAFLLLRVL